MYDILQKYETGFQKFGLFRCFPALSHSFKPPDGPRSLCSAGRKGGSPLRKYKDSKYGPNFSPVPGSLVPRKERSDQTSLTQQPPGKGATHPPTHTPHTTPGFFTPIFCFLRDGSGSASPRFSPAAAAHLGARGQPAPAPQSRGQRALGHGFGFVAKLPRSPRAGPPRHVQTHAAAGKPVGSVCRHKQGPRDPRSPAAPSHPLWGFPFPGPRMLEVPCRAAGHPRQDTRGRPQPLQRARAPARHLPGPARWRARDAQGRGTGPLVGPGAQGGCPGRGGGGCRGGAGQGRAAGAPRPAGAT